jgi:hypothetical protein
MKIVPESKTAVFLGSSLDLASARSILSANYFPPIRMGDIYRLLAANLDTIIIIDGEFHASTPIWPREILSALKNGITVIGAASMGALRALELAPYGMIGTGVIYNWYKDGLIEGDDEVSLLHASAEQGYKNISEPLVNIRYTLAQADKAGLLTASERNSLLCYLKKTYYGYRTYPLLFEIPEFQNIPAARQKKLRQFIKEQAVDLKRKDAQDTLKAHADGNWKRSVSRSKPMLTPTDYPDRPLELLMRGLISVDGTITPLRKHLEIAAKDQTFIQRMLATNIRRFYLLRWMDLHQLVPPRHVVKSFRADWLCRHLRGTLDEWFSGNGITRMEFEKELDSRAAEAWLVDHFQKPLDIDRKFQEYLGNIYTSQNISPLLTKIYETPEKEVRSLFYIANWAKEHGIECPEEVSVSFREKTEALTGDIELTRFEKTMEEWALVEWLIAKTPVYFGFDQWSADVAAIRELQMTGYFVNSSYSEKEWC